MEPYRHTQWGHIHFLFWVIAAILLWGAAATGEEGAGPYLAGLAALFLLLGFFFASLTVTADDRALIVRFGPIPLVRKRWSYDRIRSVRPARSSVIDGWGIHYIPWRGWIYNIWGFSCVELGIDDEARRVRIGTNDRDNLVRFLEERIGKG